MGFVPLLAVNVQLHQTFDIAESKERLFGKRMVTCFLKVCCAELDIRSVLLLVQVLANLHDLIQILLLTIDFDGLLVLACLNVQISSFFPIVRISFKFSLLD